MVLMWVSVCVWMLEILSKAADAAALQHLAARSHLTFSIVLRPIRFELFEKEVQRVLAEFQPRRAVVEHCQCLS